MKLPSMAIAAAFIVSALAASASFAANAPAHKISAKQAEAAAIRRIPGKVVSSQYELEDGHWQYAVLVRNKKGLYEVEVNSLTGKVTDTEKTSMAEERAEAASDKAAAARHRHGVNPSR